MSEKVVLRFQDGSTIKGSLRDFSETAKEFSIEEYPSGNLSTVRIDLLKAIFFVRSFEGNPSYREIKRYGISSEKGRKVYVRFKTKRVSLVILKGSFPGKRVIFSQNPIKTKQGSFLSLLMKGATI